MFSLLLATIGKKVSDKDATTPFFVRDVSGAANTLSIVKSDSGAPTISIQTSADGVNWTTLGNTSTTALTVTIPANGRVYLRSASAVTAWASSSSSYNKITASGNHHIGGNILSLLMGADFSGVERFGSNTADYAFCNLFRGNNRMLDVSKLFLPDNVKAYCYYATFYNCTRLVATPTTLPATTLAIGCYSYMFRGCTSLTATPTLPATTLARKCYSYMFYNCTSLTAAPVLSATTMDVDCYYGMFIGCTSLTTAPALPATTLASGCYGAMFKDCTALTTAPTMSATTMVTSCCANMFEGCTSLTTAPTLSATTLAANCYESMFVGCTSLVTAPAISATTLANNACQAMFQDCTALTTAPTLSATTLAAGCYEDMFYGCTSLATAPVLPATTMAAGCYAGMFRGCTSLTAAPELPATTLADSCYMLMFESCTSLTEAPELPAETLATNCYGDMFNSCTSLVYAPDLPATTLVAGCYTNMFYGCSLLSYIKALFTTTPSTTYTQNWVYGVAATGIFVKSTEASWNVTGDNGIPVGWIVYLEGRSYDIPFYVENRRKTNGEVLIGVFGVGGEPNLLIETSPDGVTWTTAGYSNNHLRIDIAGKHRLYIRCATDSWSLKDSIYHTWNMIQVAGGISINVGGNIMSLLKGSSFNSDTEFGATVEDGAFYNLFSYVPVIDASLLMLPTNTKPECYRRMFYSCVGLEAAPVLPAETLTEGCYMEMFYGCTSLTTAPELPAETLVTGCYEEMFYGCTLLNYIKALFTTTPSTTYTENWVYGVAATGTFEKNSSATWDVVGVHGVPTGWVVDTGVPFAEDLVFYAPLTQGDLTDHISGNSLVFTEGNVVWDSEVGMYRFNLAEKSQESYFPCNIYAEGLTAKPYTVFADCYPVKVLDDDYGANNYPPFVVIGGYSDTEWSSWRPGVASSNSESNTTRWSRRKRVVMINAASPYQCGYVIDSAGNVTTIFAETSTSSITNPASWPAIMKQRVAIRPCRDPNDNSFKRDAYIKDVRIYKRAFTPAELATL